jgi:hypothetical protein
VIRRLGCPTREELGDDADAWLAGVGGPFRVDVPGRERGRSRALVTLLHGNEPSGFRALHGWLRDDPRPAVDLVCFVLAVHSALLEPRFTHRMPPGARDLNRCFYGPPDDVPGRLAESLHAELRELAPEAIVDVHNTSGEGPAYGVTTRLDDERLALTSLFSQHLILTDLRLGSLMEATEALCPTVTIECGGSYSATAQRVALQGLSAYAEAIDPLSAAPERRPSVLRHPVRVELVDDARVRYAKEPQPDVDLTLLPDIDRHNFEAVQPGEVLGWLGAKGLSSLAARGADGVDIAADVFVSRGGELHVRHPVDLLMVTTREDIAHSDCLFYAIPPRP